MGTRRGRAIIFLLMRSFFITWVFFSLLGAFLWMCPLPLQKWLRVLMPHSSASHLSLCTYTYTYPPPPHTHLHIHTPISNNLTVVVQTVNPVSIIVLFIFNLENFLPKEYFVFRQKKGM